MGQLMSGTAPVRVFDHKDRVSGVAVFPDGRRMVTGSGDKALRLWDLQTGIMLKKMEGHQDEIGVWSLAISRDGRFIASGDAVGDLIIWHGETGESLTGIIRAHPNFVITSLDFSPDRTVLATGSWDGTTRLWSTTTWQPQGNLIQCSANVSCVRYSPSGELLAIATHSNIEIYNAGTGQCIANFKGHTDFSLSLAWNTDLSLAWTLDGTRLLTGGSYRDCTIREWDVLTWKEVADPWTGDNGEIRTITIHPAGMLVASGSGDGCVRLWRLSNRKTIAVFQHSATVKCATFSVDGKHILSGGFDNKISQWVVPEDALLENASPASKAEDSAPKIFAMNPIACNACIMGDLPTAEEILTREIYADANNYNSYANRSVIMACKLDWDHALQDAVESIRVKPSLVGYISKGIALCGKRQIRDAMKSFDLAFVSANGDSKTTHFLFLIKAIVLFNPNKHEEAMMRVKELATDFPDADTVARCVVEAYLRVQLGTTALGSRRYNNAIDHFTVAVDASASFYKSPIHFIYKELIILFGWDLESLWQTAHMQQCHTLIRAGRLGEALEPYRKLMDGSDEATKASLRAWFSTLRSS